MLVNTNEIFQCFILPELLRIAKMIGALEKILSISLYGSANYGSYDRSVFTEESDYDIWIIFDRDCLDDAQAFATALFGRVFRLPKERPVACILYDKFRLQTNIGDILLAPMIVTKETYGLLEREPSLRSASLSIDWYRSRARERAPRVPVCFTDMVWSEFDMQQAYIDETDIWRLKMPIIIREKERFALGTFLECALSGNCFYGDQQRENRLKKALFLTAIRSFRLHEVIETNEIPGRFYAMMTLNKKARGNFKATKIQQFAQWLSG